MHLKTNVFSGSTVNGVREPTLHSFSFSSQPGNKIHKEPRIKLFKKVTKSVLSHITFFWKMMITNTLILMEKQ